MLWFPCGFARSRLRFTLLLVAVLLLGHGAGISPRAASAAQQELTVDALSVVKIRSHAVRDARSAATLGTQREGTGVVIDASGLVLTIGYLITEAEKVELTTADGKVFPATVIGSEASTGMGLVKALAPLPVKPVELGQSASVGERDLVLIVGFDGVAPAYVVSKRPFVGYWEYLLDEAIYTAPATVNWQGAALLSRDGKLLGIGSLAVGNAIGGQQALPGNLFVPIDAVKPVLGDMIANGKSTAKPRPWLGVNTQEVQGNLIVTRVSPESPADDAGLKRGDVIVGIGGKPIQGQADFYTKLWATGEAGVDVPMEVLKGNQVETFVVKSRDRNSYFRAAPVY
ncbi:MAG TPA: S1C family serine protease [Thermoanaerobaculia bacterium]|nr:S1C family serine protease [Burkholderiales bacterium]HYC61714.1 S1C family serine protease [Thermoanaerobaculia bacterium]